MGCNGAAVEIVIDGYNVIGSRGGLYGDVVAKREAFVAELARYARLRGHAITVVFDGFSPGTMNRASGGARAAAGVRVVYAEHERADDVVIRLARRLRERATVVSSDREVRDACRAAGSIVLGAQVFDARLQEAMAPDGEIHTAPGGEEDDDRDASDGRRRGAVKRGNPRRLSKTERKTRKRVERL